MNRKLLVILTAIVVASLVLGSASIGFAAPLKDDESITWTYRHGKLKVVAKWQYDVEEVRSVSFELYQSGSSDLSDAGTWALRRPTQKGRESYTFTDVPAGDYVLHVYLWDQAVFAEINPDEDTINSDNFWFELTIP